MATGQSRESVPLVGSGFLLLALAWLGFVGLRDDPPRVDRPQEPPHAEATVDMHERIASRLWQDPLEAIVDADTQRPGQQSRASPITAIARATEGKRGQTYAHVVLVPVQGGANPSARESRRRSRTAVVSSLGAAGWVPADAGHIMLLSGLPNTAKADRAAHAFETFRSSFGPPLLSGKNPEPRLAVVWVDRDQLATGVKLNGLRELYCRVAAQDNDGMCVADNNITTAPALDSTPAASTAATSTLPAGCGTGAADNRAATKVTLIAKGSDFVADLARDIATADGSSGSGCSKVTVLPFSG